MKLANFKRILLLFTYSPDIQNSILQCRETTREHDSVAINLEVISLTNEHIEGLIRKCDDLIKRIQNTQETVRQLERQVSEAKPPSELNTAYSEVLDELKDLQMKNTKILDHVSQCA